MKDALPSVLSPAISSNAKPVGGAAAITAAICGLAAFALAALDAATPVPITPFDAALSMPASLVVFGLSALAFGLRELSVRAQYSAQAESFTASQQELEEKNRWLTVTEAHARVGHWRLNLTDNSIFWSDATYAIHGLPPGGTPNLENAINYYHEDDRDLVIENIERSRATGQPYSFQARLIGMDGKIRYIEAAASTECASDGTPIATFGVIKDRTSEEEMHQELRAARDAAKALARAKGQFLARMSHEIRTPMNGLLGFAQLLERSDLTLEQRRHTDLIIDSGQTLQTLLNDILDLSKIEAGKTEINPKTVEIRNLLKRVKQLAEPSAREKSLNLICDIAPNVPSHIEIDGLRVRQILNNLLSNAVRCTERGTVSLVARVDEGALLFAVIDTGIGIQPELHDHIFEPFVQENARAADPDCGTGLGLAISRQLARLMGGDLTLKSATGEGSVFTLNLPLRAAITPSPATLTSPNSGFAQRPVMDRQIARILLAEDYDINRELITDMADQLGYAIDCAVDGKEAVTMIYNARASGRPYHLVLMDLQMPNLGGLDATKHLRASGISEDDLPIVALTANAFADDIENCLSAGMQAHLAKPVSMQSLSEAITKWTTMPEYSAHQSRQRQSAG